MDGHEFREAVIARTGVTADEADRIIEAALATLAERITATEAKDLRSQLPDALQPLLASGGAERFSGAEFVRRFMVRSGESVDRAGIRAGATLGVLRDAVSPGEWADVLAQLPEDPVTALAGEVPAPAGQEAIAIELARRPSSDRWRRHGPNEWQAVTDDGMKHGILKLAGSAFEARVYRRPTGDTGPPTELSHGPQVFQTPGEALDYAESQLGW